MATLTSTISRRLADERGAGAVLAVAISGACLALAIGLAQVLGVLVDRQRASAAADAAALAAADTLSGRVAGEPCAQAERLAELHDATLTACVLEGAEAEVSVAVASGWLVITERARAGPPPAP